MSIIDNLHCGVLFLLFFFPPLCLVKAANQSTAGTWQDLWDILRVIGAMELWGSLTGSESYFLLGKADTCESALSRHSRRTDLQEALHGLETKGPHPSNM